MRHATMRQSSRSTLVALLVVAAACDGGTASSTDAATTGGSLIIALQTDVGTILPPTIRQVDQKTVADQIFEPLAWLGDDGNLESGFRPALADSWAWEGDSTILVFALNPRARWHDGRPVHASDVRFTFAMYTDPEVSAIDRQALLRIDSVTVRDSLTPVFWFGSRYPEQLYDAAARMLIIPEHLLGAEPRATLRTSAFGRSPIGSGRFRVAKWDPAATIELVVDTTHYRGRAKLDRVIFAHVPDANALVARLGSGELDAAEVVNSDHFRTLSTNPSLTTRILPALDYAYLQFNLRDPRQPNRPHPLFGDAGLRRALTMALDRGQLVRSQFDTLGTVALAPMTRAQVLADTTLRGIPFDSAAAARSLDSLGWTLSDGKTIRERNGRPLSFAVIVPTVSRNRMAMVVRLQEAFRKIGAELVVEALEPNTFIGRLGKRDFDAAFNGTRAEVSLAGLRPYWSVAGAAPGGLNFGSYQSPVFDAHLDSALGARGMAEGRAHASQAFATIVADAPAVWIYETRSAPIIHKRFRTAHVSVPGAWWTGLADWYIPSAERLPRDRVGLNVAQR